VRPALCDIYRVNNASRTGSGSGGGALSVNDCQSGRRRQLAYNSLLTAVHITSIKTDAAAAAVSDCDCVDTSVTLLDHGNHQTMY